MTNPLLKTKAAETLKNSLLAAMREMPLPPFKEFVNNYCSDNLSIDEIKNIVSDLNFIIDNKEN